MSRNVKPGITFYRMDSDHVINPKIRLLMNECGSDGYFIWSCLISNAYLHNGYFFDLKDKDKLELFATEFCKKDPSLVNSVIECCIKRSLFDKRLAEAYQVLTSPMMQETFLYATSERRRKGSQFMMVSEWVLIDLVAEDIKGIQLVPVKNEENPVNNSILPVKNQIIPVKNPQTRQDKTKTKQKEMPETALSPAGQGQGSGLAPEGVGEASASPKELISVYSRLEKNKISVSKFIKEHKPAFPQPYVDLWNYFASEKGLSKVSKINNTRKRKLLTRLGEPEFDFPTILGKASKSDFLISGSWFSYDWIIENDSNYLKILEGKYENNAQRSQPVKAHSHVAGNAIQSPITKIDSLFALFVEGKLSRAMIAPEIYDFLITRNKVPLGYRNPNPGQPMTDEAKRSAVIEFFNEKKGKLREAAA